MTMTMDEFEAVLLLHGADPDRWPDDMRSKAQALVAENAQARSLWQECQRLDARLLSDRAAVTLTAVELGTLLQLSGNPQGFPAIFSVTRWRIAGAAVTAGLAVSGFLIGFVQAGTPPVDTNNFLIGFADAGHLFWTMM